MSTNSTQLSIVLPLLIMGRSSILSIVTGVALVSMLMATLGSAGAIAQVESQSPSPANAEPDALPTENAGSADLMTEPAGTSLTQLVEIRVPAMPIEEAEAEVNRKAPERVIDRPDRYGEPGPAQPDRVEFLLE